MNLSTGQASGQGADTLTSIENVLGSQFVDTLIGIFLQTATYVTYGRLAGPLAAHVDGIARHALAVVRC